MKKVFFLPLLFWTLLLSASIIALARWLHPATFSVEMFVLVVAGSALAGVLLLVKQA